LGLLAHLTPDQLFLHSSYNEFYFLTHPALFIEDHFPDNKNWQLLKPPQSLRQFENNMYHKSEFYNKGMLSAHPDTSMIRTGNPEQVARPVCQQQGQNSLLSASGRLPEASCICGGTGLADSQGYQSRTWPSVTLVGMETHLN
jgi:hypothetical protein